MKMAKVPLRRFTPQGIEVVAQLLDMIKAGYPVDLAELIESSEFTEKVSLNNAVEVRNFSNRMDCARYLYELLEEHSSQIPYPETDKGLWTWLAVLFREQLWKSGSDKVGAIERWIPSSHYLRYYRHLLAGPYFIYKTHEDNPNRALIALYTKVSAPGEIVESLQSRKDVVRFPSVMEAVTKLYYDPVTGTNKRGAASKINGACRRFIAIKDQFDLTYDFYGMTSEQILELLPAEFDRFRKS
jgi:hypothetical protein